jgi:hypothetical protein
LRWRCRCEGMMLYWRVKRGFVNIMGISGYLFCMNLLTRDSSRGAEENELTTPVKGSSCEDKDVLIMH